ncbi:hypothetical protein R50073_28740 [Maricurvus nonylphenolicus]|uniref:substrate-binding periplasmic protein n=1 Tax=Maricurvus nonylphenolicus TaxID=1008307 RepID=UPI0036F23330
MLRILGALLLLILAFSTQTSASIPDEKVTDRTLNLCYFKWQPYGHKLDARPGTDVQHRGIAVDVARKAAELQGKQVNLHQEPYKRCVAAVAENLYDGTIYYVPNYDIGIHRVQESFMGHVAAFFVHAESPHLGYEGLEQFSRQTVAVLRGGSSVAWLQQNPDLNLYKVNRQDYLWQMVRGKRVDASIDDYLTMRAIGKVADTSVRALRPMARYAPTYMGFSEKNKHEVSAWNQAIQQLKSNGVMDRIYLDHIYISYSELQERLAPLKEKSRAYNQKATADK